MHLFQSDSYFFHVLFGRIGTWWPHLFAFLAIALSLTASAHAILNKEDSRSAVAWVGLIWLSPYLGALLYLVLGINHIRRQAKSLRADKVRARLQSSEHPFVMGNVDTQLTSLPYLGSEITGFPLLGGNRITPLRNGDETYGAMLGAIESAQKSIALSSYIFDNDQTGMSFIQALTRARARGVKTLVLVDDVGRRYSWPSVIHPLRERGIAVATFLPLFKGPLMGEERRRPLRSSSFGSLLHLNLRNHRKILATDGKTGFTGGLNIRDGHKLSLKPKHPIRDTHFRLEGPVVGQLLEVFSDDWEFATGETLEGEIWWPTPTARGTGPARVIPAGPELDYEPLRMMLHGAIACAKNSIQILSPYFLPDSGLLTGLSVASRRGVNIDLLLPRKSNLSYVDWASATLFRQLLESGCQLWLSPPPFDHSKLFVIDKQWALFGSPNWDNRSLRLNFEVAVESYDRQLCQELGRIMDEKRGESEAFTLEEVLATPLGIRLRNGVARLFSPYL